jgi:nitrite reductase (NADH) small subunit
MSWVDVCALEEIDPDSGVCALVRGRQIAVIRVGESEVHALDNFDPFGKANVLSRGIVGDHGGIPTIASPLYKQCFDLRTGQCIDKPDVRVDVFKVRVRGGRVEVAG